MATFYGGEQLVEVKTVEYISGAGAGVVYTVPTGRYAFIDILINGTSGGAQIRYNFGGSFLQNTIISRTINEGDQIVDGFAGGSLYVIIKEYKKP